MSRLDFSPAVRSYLVGHAVDPDLAYKLGVRSNRDAILYPYSKPKGGEPYDRRREVGGDGTTTQPKGEPLILWWPAGRPDPGAEVLLCEGEPDALAALTARNGDDTLANLSVAAVPGTGTPIERITAELSSASTVYLALDGDKAGRELENRIARALQNFTTLRVLLVGDGEDLASKLRAEEPDGRGWLRDAVATAAEAPKIATETESGGYRRKMADKTRDLLARGIDPDKLALADLLDEVRSFIESYIVLPTVVADQQEHDEVVADLLALWVMHTHAFAVCFATPYLRIVSAAPVSGKSLLLEVLASITRRGWLAVNPSPAVLYRKIDRDQPTLLIDEMDNFGLEDKRDVLAVLNSGYRPGVPVPRCNDKGELQEFDCYSPKAYAGLDGRQTSETLLTRSITIRMETKKATDPVKMWLAPDVDPVAANLRAKCEAWADRHAEELQKERPNLAGLFNRQAEVWWILLRLGEVAGGGWTDRTREAARVLGVGGDETDRQSQQVQVLVDIAEAFGGRQTIFTEDLLGHLNGLDESPWGARRGGEGIDARGLANMLRPFKVKPRTVRGPQGTRKGYRIGEFEDAFERYLPPLSKSVTSGTSVTTAPQSHAVVTDVTDVTATEGTPPDLSADPESTDSEGDSEADSAGREGADSGPESGADSGSDSGSESAPDSGSDTDASETPDSADVGTHADPRAGTTEGPPSDPEPDPEPTLDEAMRTDPEGVLADAGEGAEWEPVEPDRTLEITDEQPWNASEFGPASDD